MSADHPKVVLFLLMSMKKTVFFKTEAERWFREASLTREPPARKSFAGEQSFLPVLANYTLYQKR